MERDEIDELLDELRCFLMEGKTMRIADMELDHIQHQVGHDLYQAIEDDISHIMDQYEEHGFNIGFRVCFRIVMGLMSSQKG